MMKRGSHIRDSSRRQSAIRPVVPVDQSTPRIAGSAVATRSASPVTTLASAISHSFAPRSQREPAMTNAKGGYLPDFLENRSW